jgi:hypothetical protein
MKTILNSIVAATAFIAIVAGTATFSSATTIADQNLCGNAKAGGVLVDVQQFCPRSEWTRY